MVYGRHRGQRGTDFRQLTQASCRVPDPNCGVDNRGVRATPRAVAATMIRIRLCDRRVALRSWVQGVPHWRYWGQTS